MSEHNYSYRYIYMGRYGYMHPGQLSGGEDKSRNRSRRCEGTEEEIEAVRRPPGGV